MLKIFSSGEVCFDLSRHLFTNQSILSTKAVDFSNLQNIQMIITILNLPRTKTAKDLTNLFASYGVVKSCNIVMDRVTRQSKGFGFVEMPNDVEANAAIADLNCKNFDGKRIRVKQVQKKDEEKN